MCFRPAEAELPPVNCPSCGKRINRIGGQLPTKCPFCKASTDGLEESAFGLTPAGAPTVASSPQAPKPPSVSPAVPKPNAAPKAPNQMHSTAPKVPGSSFTPKVPGQEDD